MWQQLLAQVVAGAAGQAAGAAVGNSMSRDYAGDFGEQEATGWDRILRGPKVGEKDAVQRRAQSHDAQKMRVDAELETLRQAPGAKDVREQYQPQLRESDERMGQMRDTIAKSKMQRGEQASRKDINDSDNKVRKELNDTQNNTALLLKQVEAQLRAGDPNNVADARLKGAEADYRQQMNDKMFPKPQSMAPAGATITDAQKQFNAPPTPKQQALQDRLSDTNKYPTADMLLGNSGSGVGGIDPRYMPSGPGGGVIVPQQTPTPQTPSGPVSFNDLTSVQAPPVEASAPAQSQSAAVPPMVQQAAAILANTNASDPATVEPFRQILKRYLDTNPPWSPETVNLHKLMAK